jgi:hypothetical protein
MITALWMTTITIMAMGGWDWIQHVPSLLLHCLDFRVRTAYILTFLLSACCENTPALSCNGQKAVIIILSQVYNLS